MTGTTISGKITKTVTLGSAGYTSPLTISSSGMIDPTAGGASGLYVPSNLTNVTIVNDGVIDGATAASGGYGGTAVVLRAAATLTNANIIIGGYSRSTGNKGSGLHGAAGIIAGAADSITNTGLIIGGGGGGGYTAGGYGGVGVVIDGNGATLTNTTDGFTGIIGGAGGSSFFDGGHGGDGVQLANGALINNSYIEGGEGGSDLAGTASGYGIGGTGVEMGAGTLTNGSDGIIKGGTGGQAMQNASQGGNGGVGVYAYGGSATNLGRIIGGAGGAVYKSNVKYTYGGTGGIGLKATNNYATVANAGTIIGGVAGYGNNGDGDGGTGVGVYFGATVSNSGVIIGGSGNASGGDDPGYGGTGVFITNGVLINSGTISVGAGYVGYGPGDAVAFGGAGTLVVEQGAVFIGDIVANAKYTDVLELSGRSSTALTGIGTQFTNFNQISFASKAAWTIEGTTLGLANGPEINGFAAGDTIVLDGFTESFVEFSSNDVYLSAAGAMATIALGTTISGDLLVSSDGGNTTLSVKSSISGATITAGQSDFVLNHGTASKISVMSGGVLVADDGGKITSTTLETSGAAEVVSGGVMYNNVVDNKAYLSVFHGGSTNATTIKKGGVEEAAAGGVTSNTTIDGGTLELTNSGAVAGTLKFKGKGGVLEIDQTELPTTVISGFKAGDKVELKDAASGSGTVKVTKAGVVTISAGGDTYKLNIAGAKVGETNFKFSGDALTETSAKMAIQRPAITPDSTQPPMPCPILSRPAATRPWRRLWSRTTNGPPRPPLTRHRSTN